LSYADRGPERLEVARQVLQQQQRGVPAGDEQRDRGNGQGAVLELVDGDVRGKVVDAVQRLAERERVCLGRADPDKQRSGQARARGDRDRVHVRQRDPGAGQGPVHRGNHGLQVGPAGHLGHHAAEPGVLVHAGRDRVGEQFVPADQACPGLVAGSLDAEHQRRLHGRPCRRSRRMTSASAPDGW
jgi:hypothetical protein